MFAFQVLNRSSNGRARAGLLTTAHGRVETPVFMPVGTRGSVKALSPEEMAAIGVTMLLGNTYHLYLRPGCEVIERFAGLHAFMHWPQAILTDSGGFQVFSLARLSRPSDEGVAFQSHIDGSQHMLTPEKAVAIQLCLGSDIIMCLDECLPYPAGEDPARRSLERTRRWAARCKRHWEAERRNPSALFGIVQGGMHAALRRQAAADLQEIDFCGYALGGLSVGEPKELMYTVAAETLPLLPEAKPRYVMGVGTPADLVEMIAMGADMFDCVLPTRNARNGQLFTHRGTLNISNARFRHDTRPVEETCRCYTCRNYARAYLHHLYRSRELLAYRLQTLHNVYFYVDLMRRARAAIADDRFEDFRADFYARRDAAGN